MIKKHEPELGRMPIKKNDYAQHFPPELRPSVDKEFVKRWDKEIYKEASEMYITGCNYARHSFDALIKRMLHEAGVGVEEKR